jgi:NDP-sugar pyrophosphorylase family protein
MWTDLAAAERRRAELSLEAIVTVYRNQNQLQPSNMLVEDELLVRYSKTAHDERFQWIDLGLLNFAAEAFEPFLNGESVDLVDVLAPLVAKRRVLAWSESRRFFDIGTPESLVSTQEWLRQRG